MLHEIEGLKVRLLAKLIYTNWLRLNHIGKCLINCVYIKGVNPPHTSALSQLKVYTWTVCIATYVLS